MAARPPETLRWLHFRAASRRAVASPPDDVLFDVFLAADHEGHAVMDAGGDDVEDAVVGVDGVAAGLVLQPRHRIALVHEAQLALGHLARTAHVGWIEEDATLEQVAVEVGDERSDVARRVGTAGTAV